MRKTIMRGFITGGLVGATIGMYAINNMNPRERKRMMRNSKRALYNASNLIKGINMLY